MGGFGYILEVQQYNPHELLNGRFRHVGYMNLVFKTKKLACEYYDKNNPEMRSLNAHNHWVSDWNPETYLRYLVREFNGEYADVAPFDKKDEPITTINTDSFGNICESTSVQKKL